jgi:NAD(P)-dependent dehydrogenase (short-subunit alcohol dehydrogenase family)
MSGDDRDHGRRSAVVFGARNLGKAVIDLLVADGWAVAGAAVSDATLEGVTAAGALAVRADVTDQQSVRAVLDEAAHAHGGVDLVVNAAGHGELMTTARAYTHVVADEAELGWARVL